MEVVANIGVTSLVSFFFFLLEFW